MVPLVGLGAALAGPDLPFQWGRPRPGFNRRPPRPVLPAAVRGLPGASRRRGVRRRPFPTAPGPAVQALRWRPGRRSAGPRHGASGARSGGRPRRRHTPRPCPELPALPAGGRGRGGRGSLRGSACPGAGAGAASLGVGVRPVWGAARGPWLCLASQHPPSRCGRWVRPCLRAAGMLNGLWFAVAGREQPPAVVLAARWPESFLLHSPQHQCTIEMALPSSSRQGGSTRPPPLLRHNVIFECWLV